MMHWRVAAGAPAARALLLAVGLFFGAVGCGGCEETRRGAPDGGVGASTAATTPLTTSATPATSSTAPPLVLPTYEAVLADSKIELRAGKAATKYDGGFKSFKATLRMNGEEIERSSLEITIDAASVFAEPEKLAAELKSASLLEVERYPELTFVSTRLEKSEKKGATHELAGNLTLHGVLKSIAFPANIALGEEGKTLRIEAEFAVDRKDFGTGEGEKAGLVKGKVAFKLDLKLARK